MLICLNYWIGVGFRLLLLCYCFICDHVAHPVYFCAQLIVLLYSQKLFGGLLGFPSACQNQCQQTCDSMPSIQTWSPGGAHLVCAVTVLWLHEIFSVMENPWAKAEQIQSNRVPLGYINCLSLQIPVLARAGILNAGGLM